MSDQSTDGRDPDAQEAEKPTGRVHWINHATFYLPLILAFFTIATVRVYYLQLNQMITATKAARDSAYDACLSAKIARRTLLEYESGEADSHNAASGTVAQAAITTRGDSPLFAFALATVNQVPQPGTPSATQVGTVGPPSDINSWNNAKFGLMIANVGRTSAIRQVVRYAAEVLPADDDASFNIHAKSFDTAEFGVGAPVILSGGPTFLGLRYLDHDGNPIGALSPVQLESLRTGKTYLIAFGRATYSDSFGLNHWQTFCVVIANSSVNPNALPDKIKHERCTSYNRVDSNLIYSIPREANGSAPSPDIDDVKCVAPKD